MPTEKSETGREGDMFKDYMSVFKANKSVFHRNLKQDLRLRDFHRVQ